MFGGMTIWTGSGPSWATPSPNSIAAAVLGTVGFSIGLGFILKAKEYDRTATALLNGDPVARKVRRRTPAPPLLRPALAGELGLGPGLR